MDTLNYKNKSYIAPSSWADCSFDTVIKLIPFSRLAPDKRTDEVYELAVQAAFSIPARTWAVWLMTAQEWKMLKDQIAWVFTPPIAKPFPRFRHNGLDYILPAEDFADTTALELSVAFMAFTDFVDPDEPDLTALDRLIGTLCRPERKDLKAFADSDDWNGDDREPFNESRMMKRAADLASLKMEVKVAVFNYFEVQAKAFLEQYETLFGGDSSPRYGDSRGWIMLLKNIAKEGHFGNFDEVGRQYAHLVYAAALDDTITAEETRQQQENAHGN